MEENLSCEETNDSLIIDEDDEEIEIDHTHHRIFNKVENFNINESIPMMGHESFREMLERETDFLPTTHYLNRLRSDLSFLVIRRNQSLDWILKVCVHYKFGPLCIYLSMNYFDRFLTSYDLPRDKAWAFQLLSVSCLSLASKLEETDLPQQTIDLQVGDPSFVFEVKTIKRMELLVLNTLNWRLHSLTPFSFIDFYIEKISSNGRVSEFSIYRSSQFILNTIKEIEFLEFRPSEIAAAAALYVSGEGKFIDDENTMFDIAYVKKENVKRCLDLMRNLTGDNTLLSPRVVAARAVGPVSPIGVLEATCLSYKSEETSVESCTNSSESSEDNNINISNKKRRKL